MKGSVVVAAARFVIYKHSLSFNETCCSVRQIFGCDVIALKLETRRRQICALTAVG